MCFALYIGTDQPLVASQWNEAEPRFYLAALTDKDKPARQHFSKPYVYYVGSHLKCGCGFFCNSIVFTDDPGMMREYEETQQSARALVTILEQVLDHADTVEVFVTWEGRQAEVPARRLSFAPSVLLSLLEPYSADADPEVRMTRSSVEEQDFILFRKETDCRASD